MKTTKVRPEDLVASVRDTEGSVKYLTEQNKNLAGNITGIAEGIRAMIESIFPSLPNGTLVVPGIGTMDPRERARRAIAATQAIMETAECITANIYMMLDTLDGPAPTTPNVSTTAN